MDLRGQETARERTAGTTSTGQTRASPTRADPANQAGQRTSLAATWSRNGPKILADGESTRRTGQTGAPSARRRFRSAVATLPADLQRQRADANNQSSVMGTFSPELQWGHFERVLTLKVTRDVICHVVVTLLNLAL